MTPRAWTVGVDFGGTNIKVGLVGPRGDVAATRVMETARLRRPDAFVDGVAGAAAALAASVGVPARALRGIGVGAPGPVDSERGIVNFLVNVPGWRRVPLARLLARRSGCRCVIDNDANLYALGEWRLGAGRGARHMIGLTLGTGVGGGILLDGRVYRGAAGAAGEIGHMRLTRGGPRCGCGQRGCFEAYVGTAAILRAGRRAMRPGGAIARLAARQGRLTPRVIGRAARAGDAAAREVWDGIGQWLGTGLASLLNVFNPDCVVIGGGVANNWSSFGPAMRRAVRAQAMSVAATSARIVRGRLGDRAGILGAAVLVWETE
jgi:glucokinase